MMTPLWLKKLFPGTVLPRTRRPRLVELQTLEDRNTPTVFVVNTAVDEPFDGSETQTNPDLTGLSLREAVGLANANQGTAGETGEIDDDVIEFAPSLNGVPLLLTLGELTITDDLLITGLDSASGNKLNIVISGSNLSRVFNINAAAAPGVSNLVDLDNLTITAGNAAAGNGGAILIAPGNDVGILASVVSASKAANGGGIYNGNGGLLIDDSTISGNLATAGSANMGGGGLFNDGGLVTISTDSVVSMNQADGSGDGGGILNNTGGELLVDNTTFTGNSAGRAGGGIENNAGTVTLVSVTFGGDMAADGNTAGKNGGALHTSGAGIVSVDMSTVQNNVAMLEGGGMWNSNGGSMTITNSLFAQNTAAFGGGLFNDGASGDITVTNSTISGNKATTQGGGIASEGATVTLNNVTLAFNDATTMGGGVEVTGGTFKATSTIIGKNTSPTGPDVNGTVTGDFNLLSSDSGATVTGANNLVNVDPLLAPLSSNGGPTMTHALFQTSPAINAGSNPLALTTDQRGVGFPRVIGNKADIGAFESVLGGPQVDQNETKVFAVTSGTGGGGTVILYNGGKTELFRVTPFANAPGGVRAAVGDVNGDGVADVVVGTGPGVPTQVVVIDGKTQTQTASIQPFEASFTGGVFVAVGDVDGDGKADIGITPDNSGGPRLRLFQADLTTQLADYLVIADPAFRGGARVSLTDLNADGQADILAAAGFLGGPRVALWNGAQVIMGNTTGDAPKFVPDFFVFEQSLRNGVFIAGGDINGDGFVDLIAGGGPDGGPRVLVLSGQDLAGGSTTPAQLANFFAGDQTNRGGIRVTAKEISGDGFNDLIVGSGTGATEQVTGYSGATIQPNATPPEAFTITDFGGAFTGNVDGLFVG